MKKIDTVLLSISFLLISVNLMGQVKEQTFEEYQKQEQQNIQNYQQEESKAYEQYVKAEQQGLENLKKEIQEFWGTGELKLSTQKEWVEYSDDKKSRSDVDFENGVATV